MAPVLEANPGAAAARGERPRVLIVQPYLTAYRLPVYAEMADHWDVTIASSRPDTRSGFGEPSTAGSGIRQHVLVPEHKLLGGRLLWQGGLTRLVRRLGPDKVLCAANPRALSFWWLTLYCRLRGIEFYGHGQGAYNKSSISLAQKWMYKSLVGLTTRYLCYTSSVRDSLRRIVPAEKLVVVDNSLRIREAVEPQEKSGAELGVLFVGRLREGSQLDLLIASLQRVRAKHAGVALHVVGGGAEEKELRARHANHDWIHWHGGVYDGARIREISRACSIGCYPGNAGLSVVHYMALSLVPVVHDRMDLHMGPEPSYVVNGRNGLTFSHDTANVSLPAVLEQLIGDRALLAELHTAAHDTYVQLTSPPLSQRFLRAMQPGTSQV